MKVLVTGREGQVARCLAARAADQRDLETIFAARPEFDLARPETIAPLIRAVRPDVVVVDVCLEGGREGIEVARWLRELFGVPVVFVTSYSDDDTVARVRRQVPGAPVLAKPVYPQRLADAIAEASRRGPDTPLAAA